MSKSIEGGWVIVEHAAKLTGFTPEFINQLAKDSKINAYDVGPDWLISKDSLLAYKNNLQAETKPETKSN